MWKTWKCKYIFIFSKIRLSTTGVEYTLLSSLFLSQFLGSGSFIVVFIIIFFIIRVVEMEDHAHVVSFLRVIKMLIIQSPFFQYTIAAPKIVESDIIWGSMLDPNFPPLICNFFWHGAQEHGIFLRNHCNYLGYVHSKQFLHNLLTTVALIPFEGNIFLWNQLKLMSIMSMQVMTDHLMCDGQLCKSNFDSAIICFT